jgi:integrase
MSKKLTFTPTGFENLKSGKLPDHENPGLFLEVLPPTKTKPVGKKQFKYSRRLNPTVVVRMTFGSYPAQKIADARTWAQAINASVEQGIDPREAKRVEKAQEAEEAAQAAIPTITLNAAHALYMEAVDDNTHKVNYSTNAHGLKQRTIDDKRYLYEGYAGRTLGERPLASITEEDLEDIIFTIAKRKRKVQANRVACELRIMFKYFMSRRARPHGFNLKVNPAAQLHELWYPQSVRKRRFERDELMVFLKAVAREELVYRRAFLILLLTGCRKLEVVACPMAEVKGGFWTLPETRTKNREEHKIMLGPWLSALMSCDGDWLIPSPYVKDRGLVDGWSRFTQRVTRTMDEIEGKGRERWTLHDLRRTFRTNIDVLVDDRRTAELMLNHKIKGIEGVYNSNKRAAETAAGFLAWEKMVAEMAVEAGVADALFVPTVTTTVAPRSTPILLAA